MSPTRRRSWRASGGAASSRTSSTTSSATSWSSSATCSTASTAPSPRWSGESLSPYISAPFTDPFIYGSSPPPPGAGAYVPYVPVPAAEQPVLAHVAFPAERPGLQHQPGQREQPVLEIPAPVASTSRSSTVSRGASRASSSSELLLGGRRRPQPLPPGAHEPGADRHREPERGARGRHDQPVRLPAGLGGPAVQRHRDEDQRHDEHARVRRLPLQGHAVRAPQREPELRDRRKPHPRDAVGTARTRRANRSPPDCRSRAGSTPSRSPPSGLRATSRRSSAS